MQNICWSGSGHYFLSGTKQKYPEIKFPVDPPFQHWLEPIENESWAYFYVLVSFKAIKCVL